MNTQEIQSHIDAIRKQKGKTDPALDFWKLSGPQDIDNFRSFDNITNFEKLEGLLINDRGNHSQYTTNEYVFRVSAGVETDEGSDAFEEMAIVRVKVIQDGHKVGTSWEFINKSVGL